MWRVAVGVLSAMVLVGCLRANAHGEFDEVGLSLATTELPPGLYPPVTPSDLEGVRERGRFLYSMERALNLAYEDAMFRAGDPQAVAVLPLVQVDPGGESGEVVFIRWPTPRGGTPPKLTPDNAERWLLASLRLNPDSVIDVELLSGSIEKGSHDARRITSLVAAAEALRAEAPDTLFHLLDVYEVVPNGKAKANKTVAHVYALSADAEGPDLEIVVDEVRKRGTPDVLSVETTHEAGRATSDPIVVTAKRPMSMSVTRAMMRGPAAGSIGVLTNDKQRWLVDARTGEISRASDQGPQRAPEP